MFINSAEVYSIQQAQPYHNSVTSVIFDFGQVLAKPSEEVLVAYLASYFGVTEKEIRQLRVKQLELFRITDAEFAIWQDFAAKIGKPELATAAWRADYQKVKLQAVREQPHIKELLSAVEKAGYRLILLSNFEKYMEPMLDQLGYRDRFQHLFLSYRTGYEKPDPRAYLDLLNTAHLGAHQVIFIDDQKPNVDAAQALQIDSIHFQSADQVYEALIAKGILPKTSPLSR